MRNRRMSVLNMIALALAILCPRDAAAIAPASGGIYGYVCDAERTPIPNARISIYEGSMTEANAIKELQTDEDGTFRVNGLAGGQYAMSLNAGGEVFDSELHVFNGLTASYVKAVGAHEGGTGDTYPSIDPATILAFREQESNPHIANLRGLKAFIRTQQAKPDVQGAKQYYDGLSESKQLPLLISPTDAVVIAQAKDPLQLRIFFRVGISNPVRHFQQIEGTDLWMHWIQLPNDSILRYQIWNRATGWDTDPGNSWADKNYLTEYKRASFIHMPGRDWLWMYKRNDQIPHGKIDATVVTNRLGYKKELYIW